MKPVITVDDCDRAIRELFALGADPAGDQKMDKRLKAWIAERERLMRHTPVYPRKGARRETNE